MGGRLGFGGGSKEKLQWRQQSHGLGLAWLDTLLALFGLKWPSAEAEGVKVGLRVGFWVTQDKGFGLCGRGLQERNCGM